MNLWVEIRQASRVCYSKPFSSVYLGIFIVLFSLCGLKPHYVAEINTDKHTGLLGDTSGSAFLKLACNSLILSFSSKALLALDRGSRRKKRKTKSHNWNQMKEDTSEEHMSCQRLTSSHYPIREQCVSVQLQPIIQCGSGMSAVPRILRGQET